MTGWPEEALELQRETTQVWCDRYLWHEASMPLCEWLRLAAALVDVEAIDQGFRCLDEIRTRTALCTVSAAFLDLAVARAMSSVGRREAAIERLERLLGDEGLPGHLRFSARRWLARATSASSMRLLSDESRAKAASDWARFFGCFEALDAALLAGDLVVANDAVGAALAIMRQPLQQLLDHAPDGRRKEGARVQYVADFFPY